MESLERLDRIERENSLLAKSTEELQEAIYQKDEKIKSLRFKIKDIKKEKEQIDSAAEDLFERCKIYENQCEELLKYKEEADAIIK